MPITRCHHQKHIVIVWFQYSLSLLLQVDQVNAEDCLQKNYPIATNTMASLGGSMT